MGPAGTLFASTGDTQPSERDFAGRALSAQNATVTNISDARARSN